MKSVVYAKVVLFCGYVLACDGTSLDTMSPCGRLLSKELCEAKTFCSEISFEKETSNCTFMSWLPSVGAGDCRILTSRRGTRVHLCTEKVKMHDSAGESISPGDAVRVTTWQGIYMGIYIGDDKSLMYDHRKGERKTYTQNLEPVKKNLTKLKVEKGTLRIFEPKKRIHKAVRSLRKDLRQFRNKDFISWCFTGKTAFAGNLKFPAT